jgi:hypothetical protein
VTIASMRASAGARRRVGRMLLAVLVVAGLVAVPAVADEHEPIRLEPRGIDRVCPVPDDLDVLDPPEFADRGETHGAAIDCAAAYGLIGGFADGTFRPNAEVTRGQTAVIVARWLRAATGFALDVPEEPSFSDVSGSSANAIEALAALGIIDGRDDGTFGPGEPLSRGQFAQVIVRAISYADTFSIDGPLPVAPPDTTELFADVTGTAFEADIGKLVQARITIGAEPGLFLPAATITRGQMATFIMRSADYLDRHQRWEPTAAIVSLRADLQLLADDGSLEPIFDTAAADQVSVTLLVNAFNGTMTYALDASALVPIEDPEARLRIRIGDVAGDGPVAIELGDAAELDLATGSGSVGGGVIEADSQLRFADIINAPGDTFVELAAEDLAGGSVRGVLRRTD